MLYHSKKARWLSQYYEVIIRNKENFSETKILKYNFFKLVVYGFGLVTLLLLFSFSTTITVLSRFLNPAHLEEQNKKRLHELILKADTLEEEINQQNQFIQKLQNIINIAPSTLTKLSKKKKIDYHNDLNQPDESKIEENLYIDPIESNYKLFYKTTIKNNQKEILSQKFAQIAKKDLFISPIHSANMIISAPFNMEKRHFGIDIIAKENTLIKATQEGVVIFASWTMDTGWVLILQHPHNLISIYKHNALLLKKVGAKVQKGEVIAIIGNSGELSTGPHLHFELWYDNKPINPEEILNF